MLVSLLHIGRIRNSHRQKLIGHLLCCYLFLRLVLLPLQCDIGPPGAPYSLDILSILQKGRLVILLPQAWHDEGRTLPGVCHLHHIHLLLILGLILLGASFLRLRQLLRLLEHVGLLSESSLVVEVTAGGLLINEVQ